jgi:hypothetical protein
MTELLCKTTDARPAGDAERSAKPAVRTSEARKTNKSATTVTGIRVSEIEAQPGGVIISRQTFWIPIATRCVAS